MLTSNIEPLVHILSSMSHCPWHFGIDPQYLSLALSILVMKIQFNGKFSMIQKVIIQKLMFSLTLMLLIQSN